MSTDLMAGQTTEIDDLQGEVIRLAEKLRRDAPINQLIYDKIRTAETKGRSAVTVSPADFHV